MKTNTLALVGMILGIVGIVISCLFWPIGLIFGLAGLALSIVGLMQINKQPGLFSGKGMAIAGIITAAVALLLAVLGILSIGALMLLGPRMSDIFGSIYNSLY